MQGTLVGRTGRDKGRLLPGQTSELGVIAWKIRTLRPWVRIETGLDPP